MEFHIYGSDVTDSRFMSRNKSAAKIIKISLPFKTTRDTFIIWTHSLRSPNLENLKDSTYTINLSKETNQSKDYKCFTTAPMLHRW